MFNHCICYWFTAFAHTIQILYIFIVYVSKRYFRWVRHRESFGDGASSVRLCKTKTKTTSSTNCLHISMQNGNNRKNVTKRCPRCVSVLIVHGFIQNLSEIVIAYYDPVVFSRKISTRHTPTHKQSTTHERKLLKAPTPRTIANFACRLKLAWACFVYPAGTFTKLHHRLTHSHNAANIEKQLFNLCAVVVQKNM